MLVATGLLFRSGVAAEHVQQASRSDGTWTLSEQLEHDLRGVPPAGRRREEI